jgi:tetratricopeptide (TPR) repeat protein
VATKAKPRKKAPDILDRPVVKTDWLKLIDQVKANPLMYGGGAAFLLLCILAGIVYRVSATEGSRDSATKIAKAVETEDPALRANELDQLAKSKGKVAAEALYLKGEAFLEAKEYDNARGAFDSVRSQYPDSAYAPNAVEGIGFISETNGKLEDAIASYKEVMEKWASSFAARRQQFNIGRCQEVLEKFPEAVAAYKDQKDSFPGSSVAKEADKALERLKKSHPDLFPKEEAPAIPAAPAGTEAKPAAPAPESVPAPKVEAPAAPAAPAGS